MVDDLDQEVDTIKKELFRLCWYMRGGLTYAEAVDLSAREREMIANLISDNLETTKKTGMPFF